MTALWISVFLVFVGSNLARGQGPPKSPSKFGSVFKPGSTPSGDLRFEFEIQEEVEAGTLVGRIPTRPGFTYRFNEVVPLFRINDTTGEVTTAAVIDRETLSSDTFDLVILSSQPTYPIEIRIKVRDLNDHAPVFPEKRVELTFSESSTPGTRMFLDTAEDPDSDPNGVTTNYVIVDGNDEGHFALGVTPNPAGVAPFLYLETTGKLDRESRSNYVLNVTAQDNGVPPRLGWTILDVSISDTNDNPPIFDHSDYVVSLNESVPFGTHVLQVMATDSDEGDNAKVTYYLADSEGQFSVDPLTGDIFTAQSLLNCQQNCPQKQQSCPKSCVFTVFARDHGLPPQDGRTYVTVNLLATNDRDPVITFKYFPDTAKAASVDENAQNGSVVAAVSTLDQNDRLEGEMTVEIVSGNDLGHFRLESSPFFQLIRVNGVLDREKIGKYNLSIMATDKSSSSRPRTTVAFLLIEVNDVNDHDPIFEQTEYAATLRELIPIGSFVASIIAHDADTGINAQLYYAITSGNDRDWFSIDPMTGLLTTKSQLDRETQDVVRLRISARDGGPNPRWTFSEIKITILDENDEAPKFENSVINVSLPENGPGGSLVATLKALDHDQGTNGSVSYFLTREVETFHPGHFHLDPNSGQLVARVSFDRELRSSYTIQVVAKDKGSPPLSSTATVTLTIRDENDNDPVVYPVTRFVKILKSSPAGTTICNLTASDDDEGQNAELTFGTDDKNYFEISASGQVKLKQNFGSIRKNYVTWSGHVTDGGGRRSSEKVTVHVFGVNDLEDKSEVKVIRFVVVEDPGKSERDSRKIGRVFENPAPGVTYVISDGDPSGTFRIDPEGTLFADKPIDREATPNINLSVVVWRETKMEFESWQVLIQVQDVNDNKPIFKTPNFCEVSIYEDAAIGSEVTVVDAFDLDFGENSTITFSLSRNPGKTFRIDPRTGHVTLQKILIDRVVSKCNQRFVLEVTAQDSGSPKLSAVQEIIVRVLDVNNFTPVFGQSNLETSLLESAPLNSRFFTLKARDLDCGLNSHVTYTISDGTGKPKFGILPDGNLYVKEALDREDQDYYTLIIIGQDSGTPPRSSAVQVIVHVSDENDNAPKLSNSTFTFSISENEEVDSFVGKVTAVDLDAGRNAELSYRFAGDDKNFKIESRTGFVRSLTVFDREQLIRVTGKNYLTLDVVVTDGGHPSKSDSAQIQIYVKDENDNRPEFVKKGGYVTQVSERAALGSSVIRVHATDSDDGVNGLVLYYFPEDVKHFRIDSASGQITVAKHLDRESEPTYILQVYARDMAQSGSLTSSTTVTVQVLDENDNAPEFTQSEPSIRILETTRVGQELMQFRATDPDQGLNSHVTLSISGGNKHDTFFIDSKTGSFYLNKPLDFEKQSSYILNITASDFGNPSLATTVQFLVDVLDFNDNPPVFPATAIFRQIPEGTPINTTIVFVSAEDADSGLNGKVRYSIVEQEPIGNEIGGGGPIRTHFGIDPELGRIFTTRDIDREFSDTFKLTIRASDQAIPTNQRLSAVKLVTIIVEDLNDNEPKFTCMNAAILRKTTTVDTEIIRIEATDPDAESNGVVTFEIVNGDQTLFLLDRTSGKLSLRQPITNFQPRYQLTIKATDEAIQSQRKSADLELTLIGVESESSNGIGLTFSQSEYSGSIFENEPVGTPILHVNCAVSEDKGTDPSGIEYYITDVTGFKNGAKKERLFEIDARRGTIYTTKVLDREAVGSNLRVEVYAILISAQGLKTAKVHVDIEVLDRNDSPPKFKEMKKELSVSESAPVDYEIVTVTATDDDLIGNVTYSISGEKSGSFRIDPETGIVRLAEPLDREEIDNFLVHINASDGIQHSVMKLYIKVLDENDNLPTFSNNGVYSFEIPEDAELGMSVGKLEVIDPDTDLNGVVTFSVVSRWGNDVFTLSPDTGVFTLINRVDYENVQHYVFVVQAQDSGVPSLSSTATVYINILDLNDNAPVFDPMSYTREVYENVSVGSTIVTVSATDLDSGLNGQIEYSIQSGNEAGNFEIFQNGTISTKTGLDRETISSYNLIVVATDRGSPEAQSATAQVSILLRDVNDEAPIFISPNKTTVTENPHINTLVLVVNALDRDDGRNGYVEYVLANEKTTFSLGPVDGLLRVHGVIDRETRSNYILHITAKDKGDPQRSTTQNLLVTVEDENDNAPTFDSRQYAASIPENSSLGMNILEVSATDIDEGLNGQIRFSIVAGDGNRDFVIDEDTGVIRLSRTLNYERIKTYTLTIRAEDFGMEPKYDTATVLISVTNTNDNPPVFLDSPYIAQVRENIETLPVPVVRLTAFDADPNPNQQIRYLIKDGDKGTFRIDSTSGEITVHRKLDREVQAEYLLTVVAIDAGSPRLTGTGTVRVNVVDSNDNAPVFERRRYEFPVQGNSRPGTNISRLLATDADEGLNGQVKYFLLGDSPFVIDEVTGDIKVNQEIPTHAHTFRLVAEARDSNPANPLSSKVNVTLRINNLQTEMHIFKGFKGANEYSITIPEGSGRDTFVFGLSADDMLFGLGRRYFLSGPDADKFSINQDTGVVTTLRTLRSNPSSNGLFLVEINGNDPLVVDPTASVITLRISLASAHNFPQISIKQNTFTFKENTKNLQVIQIEAPKSEPVSYSIGGGNIGNSFEIGARSGWLKISPLGLDYEAVQVFDLWILGRSEVKGQQPLVTAIRLHVTVTDENDNEPVFEKSRYELSVMEEEAGPKVIGSVTASDADSDKLGEVTYSFSAETSSTYGHLFAIGSTSGEIVSKVKLDREEVNHYELTVEAVDGGSPPLSGTTSVLITVRDKNDNPPRFTRLFTVNVTENSPLGSFVIQVKSVDRDIGANANCTYIFTEPNLRVPFQIEPISGNITVSGLLDRETQDEYLIRVGAIDGSWRAETLVTITIQDLNDNAPEFEQSFYSFNIGESRENVTLVGQLIATDRDKAGLNSSVTYALTTPSDFSIDPLSGEIFTKRRLTYKTTRRQDSPENEHQLIVVARDRGHPPLSSEAAVTINIVGANNSPPKFPLPLYELSVLESAVVGDRLFQMTAADDEDVGFNALIEYSLVSGTDLLTIDKDSGWLTLKQNVTGQRSRKYDVIVRAADKGIPSLETKVGLKVTVTGPNEHSPVFTSSSYRVIVPENEVVGTVIVTLKAVDSDSGPNGEVVYAFNAGNGANLFEIDSKSGALAIKNQLDYETQREHQLIVTATDKGFHRRQSEVEVTVLLTDYNDNPPVFDQLTYVVDVPENEKAGTSILKLTASDKDSAKFGVITYAVVGGTGQGSFEVNATTGHVTSKRSFDYEQLSEYSLEVVATNPDSNLFGSTHVTVKIVGVNEFVPRFVQPVFQFVVSESAGLGTVVGTVEATDEDSGPDGVVNYLFLGSSLDRGFGINCQTGTVTVNRRLDRESQARVILTVVAKNSGPIRGHDIDEAQIIITVQDGNDPPTFEKDFYAVEIPEGIKPFADVITVVARDSDVRQLNSRFSYAILEGNADGNFRIDADLGKIETVKRLDREMRSSYNLVVGAVDLGDPPQTGRTTVAITLKDYNDNPPTLREGSTRGSILENEPIGTKVMTLEVTDLDLPPNTGPFTFRLIQSSSPPKVKVDPKTGVVTSLTSFDREKTPEFKIEVEITDNGVPPLKTVEEVTISVQDVNDNPSQRRVSDLLILNVKGQLPKEEVATLYPRDPDSTGNYKCRRDGSQPAQTDFSVSGDCKLFMDKIPVTKMQTLTTIAHDGRHKEVTSMTNIHYGSYDNASLDYAVVLRIDGITPTQILLQFQKLQTFFNKVFTEEVQIFGIVQNPNGSDLILGPTKEFRKNVISTLIGQRSTLEETVQHPVLVDYSACSDSPCQNGANSCSSAIKILPNRSITETETTILSVPALEIGVLCTCTGDFEGPTCEYRRDPCNPNPCSGNELCTKIGHDFECACPGNRTGKRCEFEQVNPCDTRPCRNGGTCHPNYDDRETVSYFCLCRPNFLGKNCSVSGANPCVPNPCRNGGECLVGNDGTASGSVSNSVRCRCRNMFFGKYCETSSIGFSEGSFMTFDPLDPNTNDISIVFSTNQNNALLLYNFGAEVGGRSDFIVLELVKGHVRFAFGGSRTAVGSITLRKVVTDGKWYRILAIRNGKVISLSVSDCQDDGEYCTECPTGDTSCYGNDVGHTGSLTFNGNPVYIGGLDTVTPLLERPGQIQTDDFIGCIQSLEVNGRGLNVSGPIRSRGISDHCHRDAAICTNPERHGCGLDGECIDLYDSHACRCVNTNFVSPNCDLALAAYTVREGGFFEFEISQKFKRGQLLAAFRQKYDDDKRLAVSDFVSFDFRTIQPHGLLFFAATNTDYTVLHLQDGLLTFSTKLDRTYAINVTMEKLTSVTLTDGNWHTVRIERRDQVLHVYVDGQRWADELNSASAHNFLDPYLTRMSLGGVESTHNFPFLQKLPSFDGCLSNFVINDNLIPLNSSGGLLGTNRSHGIEFGCSSALRSSSSPDPLSIGVTLVIIFFTVLLVAILVSFVVFRLRKSEKGSSPSLASPGIGTGKRSASSNSQPNEMVRQKVKGHPDTVQESVLRNLKKRASTDQGYQTPDIIERNALSAHGIPSPVLRGGFNSVSMEPDISDLPEHYDLENASSIAPSDIDIVYHYKGYRDNKSRGKSPPFGAHSHHPFGVSNRSPELMRPNALSTGLKSTPLARLSPSSEMSHPTGPRILTLQDISGKPYQNALLQKKEVISQSERSQSSGRSCMLNRSAQQQKKKRRKCTRSEERNNSNTSLGGLTAEEIDRLNISRQNNSSLISTLDVGSSTETDEKSSPGDFITGKVRQTMTFDPRRGQTLTSDDEKSGNDSFSCSEFEFERKRGHPYATAQKEQPQNGNGGTGAERESFRGSLSTLVASDDDLAYVGGFRKGSLNRGGGEPYSTDSWNYLNGWNHPNYNANVNVFNNIPEGAESSSASTGNPPIPAHSGGNGSNNLGSSTNRGGGTRYTNANSRPSEEYV